MYFITWCSPAALWLFHIPFHERIARMLSSPLICRLATDFFLYFHRVFRRLVHFTYFFTGCSPALWLFHIPFDRIIPFVETYFFIFSQGISQASSFHIFFPLFYQWPISFSYVFHCLFHILYMWNTVWIGGARFTSFSQVFHSFFHIPVENPVKYSVKTVHLFTWFSHAFSQGNS